MLLEEEALERLFVCLAPDINMILGASMRACAFVIILLFCYNSMTTSHTGDWQAPPSAERLIIGVKNTYYFPKKVAVVFLLLFGVGVFNVA